MAPQNVIAVIFDFDDTLTDESTTKLIETHGIDAHDFWGRRQRDLIDQGWDPSLAYLKLILDETGTDKPLGNLSNQALTDFGATLNFYDGLPEIFADLRDLVKKHTYSNPIVEFYVISSGLEAIIRGTKYANEFTEIWGCRYFESDGQIAGVMNSISFTEKTKCIYAINKGLLDIKTNPYRVNEYVEERDRRVPFENMIYIGDGFTDVPCFSLLNRFGGLAFGVFDPKKLDSPKKAWEELVTPKRVVTMNSPKFGRLDDLGALLRVAVQKVCLEIETKTHAALRY